MNFYIQLFWRIFLRKETPANVPASQALFLSLAVLSFLIGCGHLLFVSGQILPSFLVIFLDIAVLILFVHFLLKMFNFEARFTQTISALLGMNLLVMIIMIPAKTYLAKTVPAYMELMQNQQKPEPDMLLFVSAIFVLVMFVKTFKAMAQIFVFSLEVPIGRAYVFCGIYFISSLIVNDSLLSVFAKSATTTV